MASIVALHGHLLVIARVSDGAANHAATTDLPLRPPASNDILAHASDAGLVPTGEPAVFEDDDDPNTMRLRVLLTHAAAG